MEVIAISHETVNGVDIENNIVMDIISDDSYVKYHFSRNTGSMVSTYQISPENGTRYVQTELTLVFNRMDTAKRIEMSALAQNDLLLIVKDANGKYWLLGKDEPVRATAGDGQTGTARADRNGYSITFQDNSFEMPYEVDGDFVKGIETNPA